MDPFHRLIRLQFWLIFGLLIGSFSTYAFSETIAATSTTGFLYASNHVQGAVSLDAACRAEAAYFAYSYDHNEPDASNGAFCFRINQYQQSVSFAYAYGYSATIYVCPTNQNWTLSGTSCIRPDCIAPSVRQSDGTCSVSCVSPLVLFPDGTCKTPCLPAGSPPPHDYPQVGALPSPPSFCIGGCSWKKTACVSDATTYSCYVVSSGSQCSSETPSIAVDPTPDPAEPITPEGCLAQEMSYITMSGSTTCVPRTANGAAPTSSESSKESSATGSPDVKTDKTTTANGDGTITTTTTTTTTNVDGTVTVGSQTDTQDTAGFCEENPDSTICLEGKWSGSCDASFQCDGDAVQCATAQAVWKSQCDFQKMNEPSELSDIGNAAASGTDTTLSDLTNGTIVDVQGAFNSSQGRWLSGSLPPVSFSVLGVGYSLDTSFLAQFMQAIGYILVSIAGVVGIRIIGGQQT